MLWAMFLASRMTYLTINATRTVCDRELAWFLWVWQDTDQKLSLFGSWVTLHPWRKSKQEPGGANWAEDPTWRHGGTVLHWTVPRSTLSYPSYTSKDYLPSDGTYSSGLDLLNRSSINKMPYRQAHRSIWWWHFPSCSCLGLCQLDKQNNQHILYKLLMGKTYSRPEDTSQC